MVVVDAIGCIVLVNTRVETLFGYRRDELIGQPVERLLPDRFRARLPRLQAASLAESDSPEDLAARRVQGQRKDGTEFPIEVGLRPVPAASGRFTLASILDLSPTTLVEREVDGLLDQLRTLNGELERRVEARTAELVGALHEREVLLQEVHHRVKNNLQVIASLISMQVRSLRDEASRTALLECGTRVQAIARIHDGLYHSRDHGRLPFSELVRGLSADVFEATGVPRERVALDLALEDVVLPVEKAIPCALILNELLTNALKHGFRDGRRGTIRVELAATGDKAVRLAVGDDGAGLPPGFDLDTSTSLGLQLVRMLSTQLHATLEVDGARGARFRVTIPSEA